jgi:hypothetical protein
MCYGCFGKSCGREKVVSSGSLFPVTGLDLTTFGILERMATMMEHMIATAKTAPGPKSEKEAAPPAHAEADLRVIFLSPTRSEDAQTEGCNV